MVQSPAGAEEPTQEPWSLRPARPSDGADLHQNCFPEQSLDEVESYLRWCLRQMDKGHLVRLVAEIDDQVVANGQLFIHREVGEIGSLVVAAPYRRRGIGGSVLQALVTEARNRQVRIAEILVRSDLHWVRAWYQRLGFVFHQESALPGNERVVVLRLSLLPADHPLHVQAHT